jgi:hypothetical protein
MRNVDDIEHAKGDRYTGGDSGVEAAEQQSCDNGVDQKIEGNVHTCLTGIAVAALRIRCSARANSLHDAARRDLRVKLAGVIPPLKPWCFLNSQRSPAMRSFAAVCRKVSGLASPLIDQRKAYLLDK